MGKDRRRNQRRRPTAAMMNARRTSKNVMMRRSTDAVITKLPEIPQLKHLIALKATLTKKRRRKAKALRLTT